MYADYKDQTNQTLDHILGSFLHQLLVTAQEPIPDEAIQILYKTKRESGKVGVDDTKFLLKVRIRQLKHAFICIDAADELEPKVRRQLLDALRELSINNIWLFLTGRGHIESEVQRCFQATQLCTVVINASQQDIEVFVKQQIIEDPYSDAMDEVLEKDMVDAIIKKSHGM